MSAKPRADVSLPWSTLGVLLSLLGGLYLYFGSLQSARPSAPGTTPVPIRADQSVELRLWQDPFAAPEVAAAALRPPATRPAVTVDYRRAARAEDTPSADLRTRLGWRLRDATRARQEVLVIPVMVEGQAFPELVEGRLRARQAVLSALGVGGFVPYDTTHIGLGEIDVLNSPDDDDADTAAPLDASHYDHLAIPYEWCQAEYGDPTRTSAGKVRWALVLWLRDEQFARQPLARLADMLTAIGLGGAPRGARVHVLGPRNSTTLRAMVEEAARGQLSPRRQATLSRTELYAATPTAWDQFLVWGVPFAPGTPADVRSSPAACVEHAVPGLRVHRTIATDEQVANTMMEELGRRGVNPKVDRVALIAEWDTFYGRALPRTFEARVRDATAAAVLGTAATAPGDSVPVESYTYLRGIDGADGSSAGKKGSGGDAGGESPGGSAAGPRPREMIEGTHQRDYLRRLADRLESRHRQLMAENGAGIKAVGILGSDVYDKLMILHALRPRLPGVIFFTNNLDARMSHPDEWEATRNMVVVSPYGLTLNPRYQRGVPPFRDSYQTALFAATLMASGRADPPIRPQPAGPLAPSTTQPSDGGLVLGPPRIFEIGRSGPVDLSIAPQTNDALYRGRSIQPERPDAVMWWTNGRIFAVAMLIGMGLALLAITLWWLDGRLWADAPRLYFPNTRALLFGAIVAIALSVVVYLCYRDGWEEGEPFAVWDGVSLWPSEMIRALAVVLGVLLLVRARAIQESSRDRVAAEYWRLRGRTGTPEEGRAMPLAGGRARAHAPRRPELRPPHASAAAVLDVPGAALVRATYERVAQVARDNITRHLGSRAAWRLWCGADPCDVEALGGPGQSVVGIWQSYRRNVGFMARLKRVALAAGCYVGFSIALLWLTGFPHPPFRGNVSRVVDAVFTALGTLTVLVLVFYVVDMTRVDAIFIRLMAAHGGGRCGTSARGCLARADHLRLIAAHIGRVSEVIYYPFVIVLLLLISRFNFFDGWDWPLGLVIIFAANVSLAIGSAFWLYRAVASASDEAAADLRRAAASLPPTESARAKSLTDIATQIERREGEFQLLSERPWLTALLVPSSGLGIWAIFDQLGRLF